MKYFCRLTCLFLFFISVSHVSCAQYTHQDTLRGSVGTGRDWWNVLHYDLLVDVDIPNKSISGKNTILFEVTKTGKPGLLQLDMQRPMEITSIEDPQQKYKQLSFRREGNVYWIEFGDMTFTAKQQYSLVVHYKGVPRAAVNPPWDGGWIWTKDEKGRPWITVACQGLGASVWYPCKDYQGDEPDRGATLSITVPDELTAVGNGVFKEKKSLNGRTTWRWEVKNPINNYTIIPYIGYYTNFAETFDGEKGKLECSYWVLDYNIEKARKQFVQVAPMMRCFEQWFGPYPFYEDSYKLVETPHLGMEHQSAVAYGNRYKNGYLGMDRSGSKWGLDWDYIIVHESGHEWFANNITTNDIADMWVHEGFTTYSEVLFVECKNGVAAGDAYCQGLRRNIENDKPIIGPYGVNKEGSSDMYDKGANMIHTIRQLISDDNKFKAILRGLNSRFYHKTINTNDVEKYISKEAGKDLQKVFDQYLRTVNIPQLEYELKGNILSYRWTNCIKGFNMPVRVLIGDNPRWIEPTENWQKQTLGPKEKDATFAADKNFYITVKKAG